MRFGMGCKDTHGRMRSTQMGLGASRRGFQPTRNMCWASVGPCACPTRRPPRSWLQCACPDGHAFRFMCCCGRSCRQGYRHPCAFMWGCGSRPPHCHLTPRSGLVPSNAGPLQNMPTQIGLGCRGWRLRAPCHVGRHDGWPSLGEDRLRLPPAGHRVLARYEFLFAEIQSRTCLRAAAGRAPAIVPATCGRLPDPLRVGPSRPVVARSLQTICVCRHTWVMFHRREYVARDVRVARGSRPTEGRRLGCRCRVRPCAWFRVALCARRWFYITDVGKLNVAMLYI